MRRFAALMLGLAAAGGCYRSRGADSAEPTVISVDNQSFYDFNIFVLPQAANQVRLGLASAKRVSYFTVPAYLMRQVQQLRFVARPLATQTGEVSEEIVVTPGDTVGLLIPPG